MTFNVTGHHIAYGRHCSGASCPVALAIRSKLPSVDMIDTILTPIIVCHNFIRIRDKFYKVPKEVQTFITAFDKGDQVQPFSFDLDLEATI